MNKKLQLMRTQKQIKRIENIKIYWILMLI